MKKTTSVCLMTASVLAAILMNSCRSVPDDVLKASIQVTDVETKWVSKYYEPWPPRLILVPVVSFRVKNVGTKPLEHVNFNAIFKFKGDPENLGDNFLAALRGKIVMPGESSEIITLKSNFGVEGKTVASFKDNVQWKPTEVKIFARSKGSQFVLLGEWDISRTIDFVEPAPVDIKKEDPGRTE
jgi:hypothetical protein